MTLPCKWNGGRDDCDCKEHLDACRKEYAEKLLWITCPFSTWTFAKCCCKYYVPNWRESD